MKKLLIVNLSQYGYHIDTYYYSKLLNKDFVITYLCWDYEKPRITTKNVNVIYLKRDGNKIIRYIRMLIALRQHIENNSYDILFVKYFRLCSVLVWTNKSKNIVLDIRTGAVSTNILKRLFYKLCFAFDKRFFKKITIISESLREALKIDKSSAHILPLGSVVFSHTSKVFDRINLLYVGTLSQRKIDDTVTGVYKFLKTNTTELVYNIIGDGIQEDLDRLLNTINDLGLQKQINYLGRISHENIVPYFKSSNIGVVYIPITKQYDKQPPTKLFEYLLSGMPVVATSTYENRKVVNESNGVIIRDNSDSFADGLKVFWDNRQRYNSEKIREEVSQYSWENIVNNNLRPYLTSLT